MSYSNSERESAIELTPNAEHLPPWPKEDKLHQLYEAALPGSVSTLFTLIESDPQILDRVSLSSKSETPLHISALAGHLDFTKALLTRKPELAFRLDSFKCSPLHLASAEGHLESVKDLLEVNKNVCLFPDAEGRIPLHLAAMRGKVEIIQELYDAEPNSIHEKVNGNYTILHLCIQYNQLEALKRLVTLVNENQLLDFRDNRDNTILHWAVMLRQLETVRYLVSIPKIKADVNALIGIRISALDVLEHSARDFKSLELRDILLRAASTDGENNIHAFPTQQQQESLLPITIVDEENTETNSVSSSTTQSQSMLITNRETERRPGAVRLWFIKLGGIINSSYDKFCKYYPKFSKYFKERDDWVEKKHKTLMLVATLTATMSFQAVNNPPGGFWQQNCNMDYGCRAGDAVMASICPDQYRALIICATISFIASVSVVLLVISGLPLKNKLCTWLLTTAMVCGITSTTLTYLIALWLVVPEDLFDTVDTTLRITLIFWISLVGLVAVVDIIRLLLWPCSGSREKC